MRTDSTTRRILPGKPGFTMCPENNRKHRLHFTGDLAQPVFVLAEVRGYTGDGGDVMNLVDVHDYGARAESTALGGVQFQGSLCRYRHKLPWAWSDESHGTTRQVA